MKALKTLTVVALLGVAINSQAGYQFVADGITPPTAGDPTAPLAATGSGSTVFTFKILQTPGGLVPTAYFNFDVSQFDYLTGLPATYLNITGSSSTLAPGTKILAANLNTDYSVTVNWTIASPTAIGDAAWLHVNVWGGRASSVPLNVGTGGNFIAGQSLDAYYTVPEPGQAIAGVMLLGCGALVFTGRRWVQKNKKLTV